MAKPKATKAKAKAKATNPKARAKPKAKAKAKPAPKAKAKAKAKAKPAPKARAKAKAKPAPKAKPVAAAPARTEALFECGDLALCVIEAMVQQQLITTETRIPMLAPEDDDDLDDESESWRDRVVDNQTAPRDALVAQLAQHTDKLGKVTELSGVLIEIAEEYEPEIYSLVGIEVCTGLERIEIWSSEERLDLSPLATLPKLVEVDLSCASRVADLRPLLAIPNLKKVTGTIDDRTADELRRRGVEVEAK